MAVGAMAVSAEYRRDRRIVCVNAAEARFIKRAARRASRRGNRVDHLVYDFEVVGFAPRRSFNERL
jgi:hypothetical protein